MPAPSTLPALKPMRGNWVTNLIQRMGFGRGGNVGLEKEIHAVNRSYGTIAFNGGSGTRALLGSENRPMRSRDEIYAKYQTMLGDPIVSAALKLHCTAALGGHETTGEIVFIEKRGEALTDARLGALVDSLADELAPVLNRIAYTLAFNAAAFGDSYARPYFDEDKGLVDAHVDELVIPPAVQAYERGGTTAGYLVYQHHMAQPVVLNATQLVRMRLPRQIYLPQPLALEKTWRACLETDLLKDVPLMPALVGGSFLDGVEEAYDRYLQSLLGMVSKRARDSVEWKLLMVQTPGMTEEQRELFLDSLSNFEGEILDRQKLAVEQKKAIPVPLVGIIPTNQDKQVVDVRDSGSSGGGGAGGYSIDDVMMNARLLAGALGIDLSMLGFADQLSGGFGDGGFFRTSAQAAERSRILRVALDEAFNQMVDLHLAQGRGVYFQAKDRPWRVNFYGTIAALEKERSDNRLNSMNMGQLVGGVLQQMKDLGLGKKANSMLLTKVLDFEEDQAALLADALDGSPPTDSGEGF